MNYSTIDNKRVSIIVTIYNEKKYIAGYIKSVIAQNIELFLVDGMLTNSTRRIINNFIKNIPGLGYLKTHEHTRP